MIHVRGTDIWIMISKKKNLDNNLSRIVFFSDCENQDGIE